MDKGELVYEYNMMIIERYHRAARREARSRQAPDRGQTRCESPSPASPAEVVLKVDGQGSRPARP
ncbi:MAG: hypothetical protein MZV70_21015 [Desulfobacterales bacterium]|nr:hypothetical protein [Desulfobacterales bacterium]